jgi:catechol 2,3-dioxygenase-like lactoylglutathione lyase family enzyme
MKMTCSTISLNVDDVSASRAFLLKHFGFHDLMADEHNTFASLGHPDTSMTVVFVRRGCEVLPEDFRDQRPEGVILAFTVDDLEQEEKRLRAEGVAISLPIVEEPWGERLFMVTDPNGIRIEVLTWNAAGSAGAGAA